MAAKIDHFSSVTSQAGQKYFVWTQWKDGDGFEISLFSGVKAWKGKVPNTRLTEMAKATDVDRDEFIGLTKEALAGAASEDGKKTVFTYDVTLNRDNAKLIWKKRISEKIQFQLGAIEMDAMNEADSVFDTLMEHSSDRFSALSRRLKATEDENYRLSEEHKRAIQMLDEAVQAKTDAEERLLSSFVDVLNSKKRKINELTEEIDRRHLAPSSTGMDAIPDPTPEPSGSSVISKNKRARRRNADDDQGEDTDEEEDRYEQSRQENKAQRGPKLDNMQLIMTHEDKTVGGEKTSKGNDGTADGNAGEEDALFVPKKKQRTNKRGGIAQQSDGSSISTRSKQSAGISPAGSRTSARQTRNSSTGGSANMISKLS